MENKKISSSGTQNLDEAMPISEKWFDDIHAESERLKKQSEFKVKISPNNEQQAKFKTRRRNKSLFSK